MRSLQNQGLTRTLGLGVLVILLAATAACSAGASTSGNRTIGPALDTGPAVAASEANPCDRVARLTTDPETLSYTATVKITAVSGSRQGCWDQVVFDIPGVGDLSPVTVGYVAQYVPQVQAKGSAPVLMPGHKALLQVTFKTPNAGAWKVGQVVLSQPDWPSVHEVRYAGGPAGRTTFGIGVAAQRGFHLAQHRDGDVQHITLYVSHRDPTDSNH